MHIYYRRHGGPVCQWVGHTSSNILQIGTLSFRSECTLHRQKGLFRLGKQNYLLPLCSKSPRDSPELRVSFYPSAPLTGDCLQLYNHFVVSHFGELVCEHARRSFCQEHKCKCLHEVFDFRAVSLAHVAPAAGDSCDVRRALWNLFIYLFENVFSVLIHLYLSVLANKSAA